MPKNDPDPIRFGRYAIRSAQRADLERLTELFLALQDHVEASNADLWRMNSESRGNLKGQIAGRLKAESSCAIVAEHDEDGVVGMVFGRIINNKRYIPSQAGQIDQAFVRADHRRGGVGSCLVAQLCRFFAGEGVTDISLRYVVGNEEASRFWTALGFAPRIVTAGAERRILEKGLGQNLRP
jgi:ribosomal protein S18 acetylase RimI-like enzyme